MRGRSLRRARTIGGLIGVLMAGIVAAAILGGSSYAYPLSFSGSATDTNLSFLSASPTISSDQPDYFPGSTVTLTGTGWDSGESVQLFVNDDEGKTWSYSADVVADSSGEFTLRFDLPTTFVSLYQVTATGATSGTARTSFTDGNVTAATIAVRKSDCTTAGTSFILGDVACAHSSITTISGNQVGDAFVQWVNPSNTVASTVTHANASQGDSFNDSFTPNAAGTWTVKVCSNNSCNANQTLDSKTFTVVSDTTPPTVTVTTPAVPGGQAGFFNATQAPVTVSVSADDVSGVTNLSCTDNGSPVTVGGQAGSSPRTGSFQLSSDGTHSVVCVATDGFSPANTGAAGGSSNTATVKIDATAPSVNLTFGRTPDHAGWYTSSVLISASGTDGGSGINNCTSAAYGGQDNASA